MWKQSGKHLPSTHKEPSSKPCEVAHTVIRCREQSLAKPLAYQAYAVSSKLQPWVQNKEATWGCALSSTCTCAHTRVLLSHKHVQTHKQIKSKKNQSISEEIIIKSIKQNNTITNKNGKLQRHGNVSFHPQQVFKSINTSKYSIQWDREALHLQ